MCYFVGGVFFFTNIKEKPIKCVNGTIPKSIFCLVEEPKLLQENSYMEIKFLLGKNEKLSENDYLILLTDLDNVSVQSNLKFVRSRYQFSADIKNEKRVEINISGYLPSRNKEIWFNNSLIRLPNHVLLFEIQKTEKGVKVYEIYE